MSSKGLSRRDFLHLSALTAASVLAASCQPAAPAEEAAPADKEEAPAEVPAVEPVVIEWWDFGGDEETQRFLQEAFYDTFNAHYDDIDIDRVSVESADVLRTALQGGSGPDIFGAGGPSWSMEVVDAGFVLDLNEYADELGWQDKLLGWAYDTGVIEGKLYSLPQTYESMVVFYNKTLFEEKGWDIPTDRAEIEALAEAAVAEEIWPFVQISNRGSMRQTCMFIDAYAGGENHYKGLIGEKPWTDEEFVGTFELWKGWMDKGYIAGSVEQYFALTYDDMEPALARGDAAMLMDGTWHFLDLGAAFEETGQEWDWFIMPSLREGVRPGYPLAIGHNYMANAKTEHPREAALALDWLVNDKERMIDIAGHFDFAEWVVPLHVTADDFPPDTDPRITRYFEDFAKVTGAGDYGYTVWTFWPPVPAEFTISGWDEVLAGDITVEQYTEEMEAMFQEYRDAGKVLPLPER